MYRGRKKAVLMKAKELEGGKQGYARKKGRQHATDRLLARVGQVSRCSSGAVRPPEASCCGN